RQEPVPPRAGSRQRSGQNCRNLFAFVPTRRESPCLQLNKLFSCFIPPRTGRRPTYRKCGHHFHNSFPPRAGVSAYGKNSGRVSRSGPPTRRGGRCPFGQFCLNGRVPPTRRGGSDLRALGAKNLAP